ncbi:hypothetical protein HS7_16920 [Sulfolobales archaeon HS-7]|nr:hypothetical protein HS7_16920 [Sulfolobales archaeon HS-7]
MNEEEIKSRKMIAIKPELHNKLKKISESSGIPLFTITNNILEEALRLYDMKIPASELYNIIQAIIMFRDIGFIPFPYSHVTKSRTEDWEKLGETVGIYMTNIGKGSKEDVINFAKMYLFLIGVNPLHFSNGKKGVFASGTAITQDFIEKIGNFFNGIIRKTGTGLTVKATYQYISIEEV